MLSIAPGAPDSHHPRCVITPHVSPTEVSSVTYLHMGSRFSADAVFNDCTILRFLLWESTIDFQMTHQSDMLGRPYP